DARLDAPTLEDCYQINLSVRGGTSAYLYRQRKYVVTEAGVRAVIFTPADAVRLEWPASTGQFAVKMSALALHDHLSNLLGAPVPRPVDFHPEVDLRAPAGARLASAIAYYAGEIDRFGGRMSPILESQFENLVIASFLLSSRHRYSQELAGGDSRSARPAAVQRALDFIHENIAEPIGLADIASAAGVSARSLQIAFSRNLTSTPMAVLRDLRLTRVHEELSSNDPESATVSSIATRWGFLHQGRFGQQYRARYGCRPVDTLRRNH
ncbi:AraC family transcriptional regulator, partial [Pseudonocardia abyssalis]|uniref:AraC family transcriptional regulator n=1 Tax=Pseudonocardia abyssalis TaxID=2792008 RepID=UPI001C49F848